MNDNLYSELLGINRKKKWDAIVESGDGYEEKQETAVDDREKIKWSPEGSKSFRPD
jgi:hypothetical protein